MYAWSADDLVSEIRQNVKSTLQKLCSVARYSVVLRIILCCFINTLLDIIFQLHMLYLVFLIRQMGLDIYEHTQDDCHMYWMTACTGRRKDCMQENYNHDSSTIIGSLNKLA